jgi:tight adherence protein C
MMPKNQLQKRIFKSESAITTGFSKFKPSFRKAKVDDLLFELPQHLELMSANLTAGLGFLDALAFQANSSQGRFADHLKRLEKRLRFGASLEVALRTMAKEARSDSVTEFANKIELSLVRGTPMADQVALLADSTRTKLRIQILRKAGKNELLMLVPLVFLILPVTIGFAVFPSLQLLHTGI